MTHASLTLVQERLDRMRYWRDTYTPTEQQEFLELLLGTLQEDFRKIRDAVEEERYDYFGD